MELYWHTALFETVKKQRRTSAPHSYHIIQLFYMFVCVHIYMSAFTFETGSEGPELED